MSVFSERLKELRGTESQASFATAIGMNRVQYAKYESGKNAPSVDALERICRVHACSADWLLGLKERGTSAAASVAAGDNSAVAIGTNARATARTSVAPPGDAPICAKCPHLKKLQKLEALISK